MVDGAKIREAAFQQVRLDYVAATLDELGAKPKRLLVRHGELLADGLAGLGFEIGTSLDESYDFAYYADTFEVTGELSTVVRRAAKAVKPGGILFYDTVNRTAAAKLVYLGAFQRFPITRIMSPGRYSAERLRPPDELTETLRDNGFDNQEIRGFKPRTAPALVKAVLAAKRGDLPLSDVAAMADFVIEGGPLVTYLGYAVRSGSRG